MSGSRRRKKADVLRMARALSMPGIDPRAWVATALVEDEAEAYRWDPRVGWIVDVTVYGGPTDQASELPVRVAGPWRVSGGGEFYPPQGGSELILGLPGGNVEENPVALGALTNETMMAPTQVAGLPILVGSVESPSTPAAVSPWDTEIKVSPFNRREEYGGETFLQSRTRVIETTEPLASLKLGSRDAMEPFILGQRYTSAEASFLAAMATAFGTLATASTGPLAPLAAAFGTAQTACQSFAPATYLSKKILGE